MTELSQLDTIPRDFLMSAPYTIYAAAGLSAVITMRPSLAYFTAAVVLCGDVANKILKHMAKYFLPDAIGQRPVNEHVATYSESFATGAPAGCGVYPTCRAGSHTYGMPSGHAQITSFAATYWTLMIWNGRTGTQRSLGKGDNSLGWIVPTATLWLLSLAVWIQRVHSRCHSVTQIVVGAACGSGLAYLAFRGHDTLFGDAKDDPKE
jgi:membrane-associated phospholipid phosphatase